MPKSSNQALLTLAPSRLKNGKNIMAITYFRSGFLKWTLLLTKGNQLYAYTYKTKKKAYKAYLEFLLNSKNERT